MKLPNKPVIEVGLVPTVDLQFSWHVRESDGNQIFRFGNAPSPMAAMQAALDAYNEAVDKSETEPIDLNSGHLKIIEIE